MPTVEEENPTPVGEPAKQPNLKLAKVPQLDVFCLAPDTRFAAVPGVPSFGLSGNQASKVKPGFLGTGGDFHSD